MGSMTKGKTSYDETRTKEDSTQQTTPWAPASGDLTAILGRARDLYESNPSGLGSVTDEALQGIANQARAGVGQGTQEAETYLRGLLGAPSPAPLSRIPGVAGYRKEIRGLEGPSFAEQNLADVAAGKNLGGDNPYVNDLIQRGQHDAANEVAARFASSGRYGSGQFAGAVADRTGRIATETLASQYDKERARQVEANQLMEQGRLGRTGARVGIRGAISDIQGRNIGYQQQDVQNQLADRGFKAGIAGSLPAFDEARYAPLQKLLGVGQLRDQAPWQQLGLWSGVTTPMAQAFGTTTGHKEGTKQEPRQEASPMQTLLGGILGVGGLAAKFYKPGFGFLGGPGGDK